MIGVTIGIGEGWADLAKRTAMRMSHMTGLECRVITADPGYGAVHPSWLKCHIHRIFPKADSFLVFDADIYPLQEWDPHALFQHLGRPFMAVPEPNANAELLEECRQWGLGYPDTYVNAGLTIYGIEHGYVWDRTWTHHPEGGSWIEQTALNHSLAVEAVEMCRLPRCFNLMAHNGRINGLYARATLANAVNLHCCSQATAAAVTAMQERVEAYVSSGLAGRTRLNLLEELPQGGTGAELGVFCGDFSRQILETVRPEKLHLVDLFSGRVTSANENGQNFRTVDMEKIAEELAVLDPAAEVVRADSRDFLTDVISSGNLLDWIYLDTSHEYAQTREELIMARAAVKPGGIIAGHDYSRAFPGVLQAVTEFCAEHGLPIQIYDGDLLPSFAIPNQFPEANQ